jgi:hypothetical protein
MNGRRYIITKQTEWAKNRGINLVGKMVTHGYPAYTTNIDENLFQPLRLDVRKSFKDADGDELGSCDSIVPGKMQAIHSSSALAVNVFQYWKSILKVSEIAAACGLCKPGSQISRDIKFEEKYPINDSFKIHPNIDVVIHNDSAAKIQRFAIECKFSEAYGTHGHGGLKQKYLDCGDNWNDIPKLRAFAQRICPDDKEFKHLHPAQLIKHILGLKRQFGRGGFRLLYLWYDVFGEQGKCHRDEITLFTKVAKEDGIKFHSLTYQELIIKLAGQFRSDHKDYIQYVTERYL